jgi:Smg protein
MFEVLLYLFENYFNPEACPQSDALVRKLSAVGFERDDIDEALDWLDGLSEVTSDAIPQGFHDGAVRVYSAFEYERLGSDAIGFLAFLESAGVLDHVLRELIIDRAVAIGDSPISIEQLKVVVLMILWSQEAEVDALVLEELLDDGSPREIH